MEEIEISGGSMSKLRNGHGSKCMCGKGRKVVLGPDNIKKLKKGGMRILRLSPEEIAENKKRMTDMMEGARGHRKGMLNNVVVPDGAKTILKPKKVEGSGKVLHDWKDLFGGTIKRDAIDEIEDGDKRKAIDLVEMLRRPEQFAKGKNAFKKVVDTADSELSKMGKGAKRAAGFTKKKFGDAIRKAIEGMGMEDRDAAIADMEGGKFSLHAPEWGIHKGSDLSKAFHSIVGAGPKKAVREKRQGKAKKAAEQAPQKSPRVLPGPAEMPNAGPPEAKKKKKTKAELKKEASERMKKAWADGKFGAKKQQAQKAGSRIKDPLAWSTTKVPNKCGSDEQREEAREAAQILQRCPANEERRDVRSDKIKQWEAKIRQDEREKIEGKGLYAGYPHGGGFIQPTGGMIRGGSIGARLAAPTNVGAGGNLLSPFAVSKRPQAAAANFHMLQQMPVAFQPKGMFSSR